MARLVTALILAAVLGATGCTSSTCFCTCVPAGGGDNTPANGTACGFGNQESEAIHEAGLHCSGTVKNCQCNTEPTIFCNDRATAGESLKPIPDKTVPKISRRS